MSTNRSKLYKKKVRTIQLQMHLVKRSYRNKSLLDKLCRILIGKMMVDKPTPDYMQDEIIDNDTGYDPQELIRYEQGQ